MLLLLLFAYLAHNATQALTIPHERENPLYTRLDNQYFDDRTIWSIIWSCLTTLFACSWVAVHPNVPSGNDSNARIQGRRLAMMGYMLLAPECVILWAAMQYFSAKEIEVKHQLEGREWTRTHGFFVIMGGLALHDADNSFLRVLDESTLTELDTAGEIEWPTITENEIQDRSKADVFSKGIVLLQTTWFIVQCIGRFTTKLAVTELEVVTLAFAVLNGITYWLWWDKPSDVRRAVPVYLRSAEESSSSKVSEARRQRDITISPSTKEDGFLASFKFSSVGRCDKHGLFFAILYILLWAPIKVFIGPLWGMTHPNQDKIPDDNVTRVPTFYTPMVEKRLLGFSPSLWTMMGVTALFGAIHFITWPSTFPTAVERWLWRISAILITGGPLLTLFLITILGNQVSNFTLGQVVEPSTAFMFYTLAAVYIISRNILLVLPLILLRDLSPTALLELKWSKFFPHI